MHLLLLFLCSCCLAPPVRSRFYFLDSVTRRTGLAFKQITTARNFKTGQYELWGVERNGTVLHLDMPMRSSSAPQRWTAIPGRKLTFVAANGNELWGLDERDYVYRCPRPCANGEWKQVEGLLTDIALSDHHVWGINRWGDFYRSEAIPGQTVGWRRLGDRKMRRLSVAGDGDVWGIDDAGKAFRWGVDSSWAEVAMPEGLLHLTAGPSQVMGTTAKGELVVCNKPCLDKNSNKTDGYGFSWLAAEATGPYVGFALHPDGNVYIGSAEKYLPSLF